MRPSWMQCVNCLYYTQEMLTHKTGQCNRASRTSAKEPGGFCAAWTCKKCLQPWRQIEWNERSCRDVKSGSKWFSILQHDICKDIQV